MAYANSGNKSLIGIFTRKASYNMSKNIGTKEIVEPEEFFKNIKEAMNQKDNTDESALTAGIALRIEKVLGCPLNQVPKYINHPHVGAIAAWRLKNKI